MALIRRAVDFASKKARGWSELPLRPLRNQHEWPTSALDWRTKVISALVTSTFRLLVRVDAPGMHRVALFAGHCGRRANGGSFFTVQDFSL